MHLIREAEDSQCFVLEAVCQPQRLLSPLFLFSTQQSCGG